MKPYEERMMEERNVAIDALELENADLRQRVRELESALEERKSTNAGWNAYCALRKRIDDAPVVGKVHWFQRFDMDCVVHTEVTWMASPPPHGTKLISKEDLLK